MDSALEDAIRPAFRIINGLSIRYAESGGDRALPQALLLSPWPESLYAYQPTWRTLAEHARLVAIDLPGFGHSEFRNDLMSPQAMGEFIVKVVDAFELDQPHIVGPDIGTSASLFAAARHPGLFKTLTVGSGGAATPLQLAGVLKEWAEAPDLDPYRKVGGRAIVNAVMNTLESYSPSQSVRDDYLTAYEGGRFAESIRYVQSYLYDLPVLARLLGEIATPVLVFAGSRDAVVPMANAEFLTARLPMAKLAALDAGHFVWEDAAEDFASLVTFWWRQWSETRGHS